MRRGEKPLIDVVVRTKKLGHAFPGGTIDAFDVWVELEAKDEKGHLRLAPELVVEGLSPGRANEFRDRELKLSLYSRQGVQEYWIVDWQAQTVEVYRPRQGALELTEPLGGADLLTSPLLAGFSCPVSSLWTPFLS